MEWTYVLSQVSQLNSFGIWCADVKMFISVKSIVIQYTTKRSTTNQQHYQTYILKTYFLQNITDELTCTKIELRASVTALERQVMKLCFTELAIVYMHYSNNV